MIIEFDDSLITGNDMIDEQHQELINRISSFVSACEDETGKDQAVEMLEYLQEYTVFHFSAEEKLQEEVRYPGYAEHKAKHEEFIQTVKELAASLEACENTSEDFAEKVKENVVDWLFNHIKAFDRSVADYIFFQNNPGSYIE